MIISVLKEEESDETVKEKTAPATPRLPPPATSPQPRPEGHARGGGCCLAWPGRDAAVAGLGGTDRV